MFVDKVRDIVGLYLSPPTHALVLSVDETSQIQALDREQPVLPMMPGVPERHTHSYVRHGTTSLFAALDIASGFVIGQCYRRHRATVFLDLLKQIDSRVPPDLDPSSRKDGPGPGVACPAAPLPCHLGIVDQPGRALVSRTYPQAAAARRPHFHRTARAGVRSFIKHHNQNPKPYRWTKSADDILTSVERFCQSV